MRSWVWRLAISAGLIGALLFSVRRLRHLDHATVALLLVLAILGIASAWGWAEALSGAIVGGIGFDYYFLPAGGFGTLGSLRWIDLSAFLIAAVTAGQLTARMNRRRLEAIRQQQETEKLYRLSSAMLSSSGPDVSLTELAHSLVDIFAASGVAIYEKQQDRVVRSGPGGAVIPGGLLREVADSGVLQTNPEFALAPVRHGGELVGSIGVSGAALSAPLLNAVAGGVGLGLARLYATERVNEAEIVRRSEELKSAVLDAMAHEFRNPLNSVKLAVTTLLSAPAGRDPLRQEMLAVIDEEVNRMDTIIDDTVKLARVEGNDFTLHKEPQDFVGLIQGAVSEMRPQAGRRRIEVSVPESLPPAECDRSMIARVVKQLLGNALKYSPAESPLTVSAALTRGAIVIDVVDHGPGVSEEERDRIFDKYYRGRAARSGAPGTGLGLASARSIVRAHRGEIWVTTPPGGGAAFHVSLPVAGPVAGTGSGVGAGI